MFLTQSGGSSDCGWPGFSQPPLPPTPTPHPPSIVRKLWKQTHLTDKQFNLGSFLSTSYKPSPQSKVEQEMSKCFCFWTFKHSSQLLLNFKCTTRSTLWTQFEFNLSLTLLLLRLWNDNLASSTSTDPPCSTLERLLQYQVPIYPLIRSLSKRVCVCVDSPSSSKHHDVTKEMCDQLSHVLFSFPFLKAVTLILSKQNHL